MSESTQFDPEKGCQRPSTGVLGGFFALLLATSYSLFKTSVLEAGGPAIPAIHGWLPEACRFENVNRDYFDLLALGILVFQFMVTWEFVTHRSLRLLALLSAMLGSALCFIVASGAPVFFAADTMSFLGWAWTRMEFAYLLVSIGLLLPWPMHFYLRRSAVVTSPAAWAFRTALFRWLSGLALFTLVLAITFLHPALATSYYENWRISCGYLYGAYLLLGLPYGFLTNFFRGHKFEDRSDPCFVLMLVFKNFFKSLANRRWREFSRKLRNRRIGIALRDLLVKLFWIPLMITFLFGEFAQLNDNLPKLLESLAWKFDPYESFGYFYGSAFHGLIIMDVTLGLIGYACSSRWLNNKSKSVEPTFSGWMVAIMCYPPFNHMTSGYLPYGMSVDAAWASLQYEWIDVSLKIVTLLGFSVYVWATMAFGLRFSNVTNRGIITRGPYAIIRHPAYMAKNFAWWSENLRNFGSPLQVVFLLGWNIIYTARALTEERHLKADPDYVAYCERVKYRFIPGVW